MSNLLLMIAPEFVDFAASEGFKIIKNVKKSEEFGNSSIISESREFQLNIYTDRGQRFVNISDSKQNWHKLEYVLEFLDSACSQEWFGEPPDLEKLAMGLKKNMQAVSKLLDGDLVMSGFVLFQKRKSADLIAKIFGKTN